MPEEENFPNVSLQFMGAAGTVTGSKHLLRTPELNILIDCGLFQGLKNLRQLNRASLPVAPATIQAVIITHAHLDHSGYLPVLFKNGFEGPVYLTVPTRALTEIILLDSAKLQEEDADHANKMGYTKHKPAIPLYTQQDVKKVLGSMKACGDEEWIELSKNIRFRFRKNGHILGSAFIELDCFGKRIVFSGDLGRQKSFSLEPPRIPEKADFLIIESTYGDRLHPPVSPEKDLTEIIHQVIRKKGNLLIPSFAVGRAQDLMLLIGGMKKKNMIPDLPVYLDSPMGIEATKVYEQNPSWHKLTKAQCNAMCNNIIQVKDLKDTFKVISKPGPKIIIAASGMLTGGRVLHYLHSYLGHRQNTILLVGYQAAGTRGKALKSGVHEIKLLGSYHKVKAEVKEILTLSAHADQQELLSWMKAIPGHPERVFLVHGEPEAANALDIKIHDSLGWNAMTPMLNEQFELYKTGKPI
ncbi:MAG: MBL fold metallo-hydrolase RNA specificity domain-containing protein [Bacteroidia bacterium]